MEEKTTHIIRVRMSCMEEILEIQNHYYETKGLPKVPYNGIVEKAVSAFKKGLKWKTKEQRTN